MRENCLDSLKRELRRAKRKSLMVFSPQSLDYWLRCPKLLESSKKGTEKTGKMKIFTTLRMSVANNSAPQKWLNIIFNLQIRPQKNNGSKSYYWHMTVYPSTLLVQRWNKEPALVSFRCTCRLVNIFVCQTTRLQRIAGWGSCYREGS